MTANRYKKVFLVDDDLDDQDLLIEAIKTVDDTVRFSTATNGFLALQSLNNKFDKPDMIFLDLNMPVVDGKQLLQELKKSEKLKDIPVVVYSTCFDQREIGEIEKIGAAHCLVKPDSFKTLKKELNYIFEQDW